MAGAVRFLHDGIGRESYYRYRGARLPVSANNGAQVVMLPWGRRPHENGTLPRVGCARLTHIQAGLWDAFHPRSVRLPITAFAEQDATGNERWFDVMPGQYLQGCVIRAGREQRVYVVTLDCSPEYSEFERWPRLMNQAPAVAPE